MARKIAAHFTPERLQSWPNVDNVIPYVHELGCGMEMTGEPMDLLRRTLAGYINNPNTAGALVVALGCERNNIHGFLSRWDSKKPNAAQTGDSGYRRHAKTIDEGIAIVESMLPHANTVKRQPVSVEHLTVGLQCGVPTDSPASQRTRHWASRWTCWWNKAEPRSSETTEIFGVEHTLTARAVTPEVGQNSSIASTGGWSTTKDVIARLMAG